MAQIKKDSKVFKGSVSYYFSVNPKERNEVISLLGSSGNESDVRELVHLYRDCLWRETRFEILKALSRHASSRSLEALIRFSKNEKDLPMSEAAWQAIGVSSSPLSECFLKISYLGVSTQSVQYRQIVGAIQKLRVVNRNYALSLNQAFQGKIISDFRKYKVEKDTLILTQLIAIAGRFKIQALTDEIEEMYFDLRNNLENAEDDERKLWVSVALSLSQLGLKFDLFSEKLTTPLNDSTLHQVEQIVLSQIAERFHSEKKPLDDEIAPTFLDFPIENNRDWTTYLANLDDERLLNFWICAGKNDKVRREVGSEILRRFEGNKSQSQKGRYIRAISLYGIEGLSNSRIIVDWAKSTLRDNDEEVGSVCYWLERNPQQSLVGDLVSYFLSQHPTGRISGARELDALTEFRHIPGLESNGALVSYLQKITQGKLDPDFTMSLIHFYESHSISVLDTWIECRLKSADIRILLSTVSALKKYSEKSDVKKLIPKLEKLIFETKDASVRGRTLDTLSSFESVESHKVLLDSLDFFNSDFHYCEKLSRSLLSHKIGNGVLIERISGFLKKYPSHPLLENFQRLHENYIINTAELKTKIYLDATSTIGDNGVHEVDQSILKQFSDFKKLDSSAASALRSAEVPIVFPEVFKGNIDKSSSVLGYCKVIDLMLEREFGKKILFPKLERNLAEFQNVIIRLGLQDNRTNPIGLLKLLNLENSFNAQLFPAHKCYLVGQSILNGKILFDQFKVLDGLRAWAVMLLLFARSIPSIGRQSGLVEMPNVSDNEISMIAKKMMFLQDARNPVAHRQTMTQTPALHEVRTEAYSVLIQLGKSFF